MEKAHDHSPAAKQPPGFTILLVGLGLIGGSLALALRGFRQARLLGCDINPETLSDALLAGAIDTAVPDIAQALPLADLVILSVYPHHITDIMRRHGHLLKPGAVVTDVCGTKTRLYSEMAGLLPPHADYIGIHPMAGKEVDGFANADAKLFVSTGFLITPLPATQPKSIALMEELAAYIGATRIATATPERHDDIIAYTSDLMHIASAGLCIHCHPDMTSAYTAGAFRDCTRIANINPTLWTELLLTNREYILPHLQRYITDLQAMQASIVQGDAQSLYRSLDAARHNKKEMLQK